MVIWIEESDDPDEDDDDDADDDDDGEEEEDEDDDNCPYFLIFDTHLSLMSFHIPSGCIEASCRHRFAYQIRARPQGRRTPENHESQKPSQYSGLHSGRAKPKT